MAVWDDRMRSRSDSFADVEAKLSNQASPRRWSRSRPRPSWLGHVRGRISTSTSLGRDDDGDEKFESEAEFKHTFIDVELMKEKVRRSLLKPERKVTDYYKQKGWAQAMARSPIFENITLVVIAINALWIAHDTDSNSAETLLQADVQFQVAENFFCAFFTLELFVRFCAFNQKRDCVKDAWFVFDSALVFMMILETWIMCLLLVILGMHGSGFGNASIIRIARLLRLSRMARMARLLRVVPELMILIKGMVAAIRSVLFTMLLLVIIMYIFSIGLTQLTAETQVKKVYFESVTATMYALLMYGCLLDGPKQLSDALGKESWYLPPIFWVFVLMATLTVMNMLVGVLCEVVTAVAATEREENLVSFVKGRVLKIVEKIDQDGNMEISKHEFCRILEEQSACQALQDVGVDVVGLVDLADSIFEDESGRELQSLSFPSFMDLVLQLRGSNVATVKDVVQLRKLIRSISNRLDELTGQAPRVGPRKVSRRASLPIIKIKNNDSSPEATATKEKSGKSPPGGASSRDGSLTRHSPKNVLDTQKGDRDLGDIISSKGDWEHCVAPEVPAPRWFDHALLPGVPLQLGCAADSAAKGALVPSPWASCRAPEAGAAPLGVEAPCHPPPLPNFPGLGALVRGGSGGGGTAGRSSRPGVPDRCGRGADVAPRDSVVEGLDCVKREPPQRPCLRDVEDGLQRLARLSSTLTEQLQQLQSAFSSSPEWKAQAAVSARDPFWEPRAYRRRSLHNSGAVVVELPRMLGERNLVLG